MNKTAVIFLFFVIATAVNSQRQLSYNSSQVLDPLSDFLSLFSHQNRQYYRSTLVDISNISDIISVIYHGDNYNRSEYRLRSQIDVFSGLISDFLTNETLQDSIRNYTKRARNLVALINIDSIRASANGVIDAVFLSLTDIRQRLITGLTQVNNSRNPIQSLKSFLTTFQMTLALHFISLNNTIHSGINNITDDLHEELLFTDRETVNDVHDILGYALLESQKVATSQINRIEILSKVLGLEYQILSNTERTALERDIRNQSNRLVHDLRGLNISNLRGVASRLTNLLINEIENFRNSTIDLASTALRFFHPGDYLNNEFLRFKSGLGQSIRSFRYRAEEFIKRFIRDTLESVNIRGRPGTALREIWGSASVPEVVESARPLIEARVNDIISIFTRLQRA